MRLESAMFTSREGLNVHGQAIAVVGDNISNANTTSYKVSRTEFADLVSEGQDGKQSVVVSGGGSGVKLGKIRQIHDTGTIEFTGRSLDVAIGGKGFFMVGDASSPIYTRAGNFQINGDGVLVDGSGRQVLGSVAAGPGQGAEGGGGTTLGTLNLYDINLAGVATSASGMVGNLDAGATVTNLPANPQSFNEMRALANFSSSLVVYDSLGAEHAITVGFFKTGTNTWQAQAYVDGADTGGTPGVPVAVGQPATLTFGADGLIAEAGTAAATINGTAAYANGAAAGNFTINLSGFSQYAGGSQLASVTQNGQGIGEVTGYQFKKNGDLVAVLSSGTEYLIGNIPLADFRNVDGLIRAGSNSFIAGADAGLIDPARAGTAGLGELEGGSLERSSVDIASEFVDIVVYQRGYQANSQVLGVANNMIRDTISLLR